MCMYARSSGYVWAQVADTLGKSFQIHLFRSLCAHNTCTIVKEVPQCQWLCLQLWPLTCCVWMCRCLCATTNTIYSIYSIYINKHICVCVWDDILCLSLYGRSNAAYSVMAINGTGSSAVISMAVCYCCVDFNDLCCKSSFTQRLAVI